MGTLMLRRTFDEIEKQVNATMGVPQRATTD